MGMYDNMDPEMFQKTGLIGFAFMMVLTLLFVAAKLFSSWGVGWIWVFCPLWGPMALGLIMLLLGIKPPGQ